MHPLNDALLGPYVPMQVTRGALVAHRYLALPQDFFPLSMSLWNDLADPAFDGVGLAGFKSRANDFLLALPVLSLL